MPDVERDITAGRAEEFTLGTRVELYQADSLKMFIVSEHQLEGLTAASQRASDSSSFFWGCFGLLGGGGFGLLATDPQKLSPTFGAIYAALLLALGVSTIWFAVSWYRAGQARSMALRQLRHSGTPQHVFRLAPEQMKALTGRESDSKL